MSTTNASVFFYICREAQFLMSSPVAFSPFPPSSLHFRLLTFGRLLIGFYEADAAWTIANNPEEIN